MLFAQPAAAPEVLAACPSINAFLGEPGGFQSLINPVLRSRPEIDDRAAAYREMLACLDSTRVSSASLDWVRSVRYHLRLFLAFTAAAPSPAALELVDFASSSDPAVRRLIESVGLAPPDGVIFLRYYESRERMPDVIRRAFGDSETRAVTISSRYIAVLTSVSTGWVQGRFSDRALAPTISHEFVHAFLNARLTEDSPPGGFPRWFHEAMAIYFSDSGRVHLTMDPVTGERLRSEPTAAYEQYERVFQYLEAEFGAENFYREIRRAVENVDPSMLYTALGLSSYEDLVESADLWWRWWPVPPDWLQGRNAVLLAVATAILGAGAVAGWRRWQPAVPGSALEVGVNRDLIAAVIKGDVETMRELIRSGASVEALDESRRSALAWAVWVDDARATELLVDHGAIVRPEIRRLAESRNCSSETMRALADALTRADDSSGAIG